MYENMCKNTYNIYILWLFVTKNKRLILKGSSVNKNVNKTENINSTVNGRNLKC